MADNADKQTYDLFMVGSGGVKNLSLVTSEEPGVWRSLFGGGETVEESKLNALYKKVPWLFRAVDLLAAAGSAIPFEIYEWDDVAKKTKGKPIDTSEQYTNAVGFFPNPKRLLWLIIASRAMSGRAYLWRGKNNLMPTKSLRYLLPTSVKPDFGMKGGSLEITKWIRTVSTGPNGGTEEKPVPLDSIIYSYVPDWMVEIGPSQNYPALAALQAAGVLGNLDEFLAGFFKRGAIKTTLLAVPAGTKPDVKDELQNWWNTLMSGVGNAFRGRVFNVSTITPVEIGQGLDNLEDSKLTESKRQDIATAFGIPMTKLFSADAGGLGGGGVVAQDDARFYKDKVIPDTEFIFEDLNDQVWHEAGYHIEINKKSIDVFQEDERERSFALSNFTSALNINPKAAKLAADVLGYEMTEDQTKMLDELISDKETARLEAQARLAQMGGIGGGNPADDQNPPTPKPAAAADSTGPNETAPANSKAAILDEIGKWRRHVKRAGAKDSAKTFEVTTIPASLAKYIRLGLTSARTDKNISTLFASADKLVKDDTQITPAFLGAFEAALGKTTNALGVKGIIEQMQNWEQYP